jgi:hypothetical protein
MGWKTRIFFLILFSPILIPVCLFTPMGPIVFIGIMAHILSNYKRFIRQITFYSRRISATLWAPFRGTSTSAAKKKPVAKGKKPAKPPT